MNSSVEISAVVEGLHLVVIRIIYADVGVWVNNLEKDMLANTTIEGVNNLYMNDVVSNID